MNRMLGTIKEKLGLSALKRKWNMHMQKPHGITKACAMLSIYTMVVFNIPAFALVANEVE